MVHDEQGKGLLEMGVQWHGGEVGHGHVFYSPVYIDITMFTYAFLYMTFRGGGS